MPLVATLVIGAIGFERYLDDASFWADEAFVAESLRDLGIREIFAPLGASGNSFPRLYMLVLLGVKNLFGYETLVLRALPIAFFLAATYFWLRLLFTRLHAFPLLVGLALFLNLLPTSWFAYSSMLKQYSFDVFLSVMLFVIADRNFDRPLRQGKSLWLCLALALPCALSYTYGIALAGRIAGWYAGGLAERGYKLAPAGVATLGIGVAASFTSLWFSDLRFMADSVYGWWASCGLGENWSATPALLDKFAMGWYSGLQEFPIEGGLPEACLVILRIAFLIGVFQVLKNLAGRPLRHVPGHWGTRSLGALFVVAAVLGASLFFKYPICSGRLTLFVLLPLQLLLFEGFVAVHAWLEDDRGLKRVSVFLGFLWIGCVAPYGVRDAYLFSQAQPPDNIRAVLEKIEAHSDLEIQVMPCMHGVVRAFPGGLPSASVVYAPSVENVPWGEDVLILEKNLHPGIGYCFGVIRIFQAYAESWEELHAEGDPVRLYLATIPLPES